MSRIISKASKRVSAPIVANGAGVAAPAIPVVNGHLRSPWRPSVAFLGCGVMAKTMVTGMAATSPFREYALCDVNESARDGVAASITGAPVFTTETAAEAVKDAEVVLLAVKPQNAAEVLAATPLHKDQLVISIVAGWTIARILDSLPKGISANDRPRVIRTMPNTPLQVGKGCTVYSLCDRCTEADSLLVERMFSPCGIIAPLKESQMDAATGFAGSGPAFVAVFMEALADGAVKQGIPRDLALKFAAYVTEGSARMCTAEGGNLHPAILKERVCSPGGTSIHGISALEDHGMRKSVIHAVAAATQRSKELSTL